MVSNDVSMYSKIIRGMLIQARILAEFELPKGVSDIK